MPSLPKAEIMSISDAPRGSLSSISFNKPPSNSSMHHAQHPPSQLSLSIDESVLHSTDDIMPPSPLPSVFTLQAKRPSESRAEAGIELHTLPVSYLSEQTRRPSSLKQISSRYDGTNTAGSAEVATMPTGEDTRTVLSSTPGVVESTASGAPDIEVSESQRQKFRMASRIHFAATCWCFFLEGWNDGSTGPLLPVIQRDYNIGFAVVSLLFVFNCLVGLHASNLGSRCSPGFYD